MGLFENIGCVPGSAEELSEQLAALNLRGHTQIAMLATATLENWLQNSIELRLQNKPPKLTKVLFSERGALGSFASKIDAAFALGSISEQTWMTLHVLRNIRNELEHKLTGRSFDDPGLSPCFNLLEKGPSREGRFLEAVVNCINDIYANMRRGMMVEAVRQSALEREARREHGRR